MTVTAPLDMGTGQQRFVVSYSIKQGAEKQPDILGAQKSECTGGDGGDGGADVVSRLQLTQRKACTSSTIRAAAAAVESSARISSI